MESEVKKEIKSTNAYCIVGIGTAGANAVNNMIASKLEGVDFIVADTDAKTQGHALTDKTILLGEALTGGAGTKGNVETGAAAARGSIQNMLRQIEPFSTVIFIAGLGGGTGTGALPVFASEAVEEGKKVFCIVTLPFAFEGKAKKQAAEKAMEEMRAENLSVIILDNQKLCDDANGKGDFAATFKKADDAILSCVKEIITPKLHDA